MIDELPAAPDPANDTPAVFNQKAAAFVLAQKAMVAQINADLAAISIVAAGGAFALGFGFDATTTAADPGAGKMRLGSAPQSSAVIAYVDNSSTSGQDATATLAAWAASTSPTKGYIKFVKQGDAAKWLLFKLTAATPASGYYMLTLVPVTATAASPFVGGDTLIAQFTPTGDAGIPGAFPTFRVQDQKASGVGGGTAANGSQTRTLNTVLRNTLPGASLASNQITLPSGTYRVAGSVPGYGVSGHQAYLYSASGTAAGTALLAGSCESSGTTNPSQTRSLLEGEIVLTIATVIEVRQYCGAGTGTTNSLGIAVSTSPSMAAIFTEILFEKVG